LISEYIGSSMIRAAIQFVMPATLGLPAADDATVPICARLGSRDVTLDTGWFVHHIRATGSGSEMRSRFWLGGPYISVRSGPGLANRVVRSVASRAFCLRCTSSSATNSSWRRRCQPSSFRVAW
jgi:hypothetical protein